MSIQKRTLLLVLLTFGWCGNCDADLIIDFSIDGGTTFGNDFQIDANSPVDVDVFLVETGTNILLNEGLVGFGLSGRLANNPTGEILGGTINGTFDVVTTDNVTSTGLDWEAVAFFNDLPTDSPIALGSFQFRANSAGTTLIDFSDIQPGNDSSTVNWLAGAGTELDEQIFGIGSADTFQVSFSTSAVPEPSSASWFMLGLLTLVNRRRRNRSVN